MGKKGRKTRWRRLPIGGPESTGASSSTASPPAEEQDVPLVASSPEHRITFNEDEYTKITTPRQDVLFKKGYLGRRRNNNPNNNSDAQELHSTADSMEGGEYNSGEDPALFASSYMAHAAPAGFMDHSAGVFYVNSGAYELYDPYMGNVTVVVGPGPAQYPTAQPVLAAVPCQPVPLNPVEWFSPPAPWLCPQYNSRRKRYSTDSQNCSAQSSESTGPPGSPQESIMDEGATGTILPPQPQPPPAAYVYPGLHMFGAPLYTMNGVNVQGIVSQQPASPAQTMTTTPDTISSCNGIPSVAAVTKRRKKRRRRRRGGVTDEGGSESSCEEVAVGVGCDAGVCSQSSQSGASSDAGGQGSSCSKTNSDSGINTEPTPDSGSNTPPLISTQQTFQTSNEDQNRPEDDHEMTRQQSPELEIEPELASSSVSTPEALKRTYESLPSEEGETLQEISCGSELNGELKTSNSCMNPDRLPDTCQNSREDELADVVDDEVLADSMPEDINDTTVSAADISVDVFQNYFIPSDPLEDVTSSTKPKKIMIDLSDNERISPVTDSSYSSCCGQKNELLTAVQENNGDFVDERTCPFKTVSVESYNSINGGNADSREEIGLEKEKKISFNTQKDDGTTIVKTLNESNKLNNKASCEEEKQNIANNEIIFCNEVIKDCTDDDIQQESVANHDTLGEQITKTTEPEESEVHRPSSSVDFVIGTCREVNFSYPSYEKRTPIPPPRRRRSLFRAAEKVAKKVVERAIENGVEEAACMRCQRTLPITEAVTRWLQTQGSCAVLSPANSDEDDVLSYEEDEGIEEGECSSTNQKNVEGNPFLVPYLSGSRQRVADTDECGSLVSSSAGEWDMYNHENHTRVICDPAASVDKYYRLGTDDLDEKVTTATSTSHSMIKTAVHIRRAGPFPCGVCCIIQ